MLVRPKQFTQEGAGDQEILSWETGAGAAMDKWEPDAIFGANYQTAESLGRSTTSSTSYQQKLRITLPSTLPAGTYRIEWSCVTDLEDEDQQCPVRIQLDDTTTIFEIDMPPLLGDSSRNLNHPLSGHADVTLTAGTHYFDMDYRTTYGPDVAAIEQARFVFWRLY